MKRLVVLAAFALPLLVIAPASAHVSVAATDTEPGAEVSVLTFTVPTESAAASTTKLAVQLPRFETVTVAPMPGWTITTKKSGDTVTEVDWAADASAAIKPGQFGEFALRVGPLPDADSVSFGALQTYSDGSVVNWNERSADGTTEPEHPAPTLAIAASGGHVHDMSGMSGRDGMAGMSGSSSHASAGAPAWVSWAALVLAGLAVAVALAAFPRRGDNGSS